MQVAVIVAHPDDEVLGCGGTLAKHAGRGDQIHLLTLADGVSSRLQRQKDDAQLRNKALKNACRLLGIDHVESADFPDNQFDTVPLLSLAQRIEDFLIKFSCERAYTHFANDLNIDHQKTHDAVLIATRPQPGQSVRQIMCFETLSSTEWASHLYSAFRPNYFSSIEETFPVKLEALRSYQQEIPAAPHTRSFENVRALAQFRGMSVGLSFAEAFYMERFIDN